MNGNLNMNDNSIINLKKPEAHQASYVADVKFVADAIVDNNTLIDTKIKSQKKHQLELHNRKMFFLKS